MGWGGGGCMYLKKQDQIINVGMTGHASAKDTKLLGGQGVCSPRKFLKFEILKLLKMH